jgi:type II secretory ATPase GspE/PulE/Tfp pilus assembly ATPase PilB-like protein
MINEGDSADAIQAAAVENGMRTLRQDTLDKLLAGKTSLSEMMRVVS